MFKPRFHLPPPTHPKTLLTLTITASLITLLPLAYLYIPRLPFFNHPLSQSPTIQVVAKPVPVPNRTGSNPDPQITAKSAIVVDLVTGQVLWSHQPDTPMLPASTTKLMTALISLETFPLDQIITITQEDRSIGNTMNLEAGEQITIQNLLYGILVASGNDAALALALSYPDNGYTGFIQAMNTKAAALGMTQTVYKNVSGVESIGHQTSARDLSILASHALNHPTIKHMVATKQVMVTSVDGRHRHHLKTTNQLLGQLDGVVGVKTGWTQNAGECLVASATRDSHQIITVVLNSTDRFQDSTELIEWTFANHTWTDSPSTD